MMISLHSYLCWDGLHTILAYYINCILYSFGVQPTSFLNNRVKCCACFFSQHITKIVWRHTEFFRIILYSGQSHGLGFVWFKIIIQKVLKLDKYVFVLVLTSDKLTVIETVAIVLVLLFLLMLLFFEAMSELFRTIYFDIDTSKAWWLHKV